MLHIFIYIFFLTKQLQFHASGTVWVGSSTTYAPREALGGALEMKAASEAAKRRPTRTLFPLNPISLHHSWSVLEEMDPAEL